VQADDLHGEFGSGLVGAIVHQINRLSANI
jgi:hypothetical protein